ncbi:hypothetical protein OMR07_26260 [Methylobacterium organophilum]|nr:hypothetical protein [Methylobacterium organophilum]
MTKLLASLAAFTALTAAASAADGTWTYLQNILLVTRYELPGVFTGNIYPDVVNGSLWTLPLEVLMYIGVMILGLTGFLKRRLIFLPIVVLAVGHFWLLGKLGIESYFIKNIFKLGLLYYSGSALFLYRDDIPWRGWIAALLFAALVATFRTNIGPLRPDPGALAQGIGGGRAAVAAHAAEGDDAATFAELLRQVQHHLIDRRAIRLRPAATGQPRAAVGLEPQLFGDRRDDHFAAANPLARMDLAHLPLAVPAHGLGQRRLEAGLDVLGIDETHRQPARQSVEKRLHCLRPTKRGSQQPDLSCWLAYMQRRIGEHRRQRQSLEPLPVALQHTQAWSHRTRRIPHQALELAEQAALPARVEF